ncbi:hypothetical protein I4U23_005955 [Adineta vaga]|nr:hypothetical protein I4U23_005955 [Adineta vaga]
MTEPTIVNGDIDLGREYAILHTTFVNLFEELNENIRRQLNELESILKHISAKKLENLHTLLSIQQSNNQLKNSSMKISRSNLALSTNEQIDRPCKQQLTPPKIGIKAFNSIRSPTINLYQEEKYIERFVFI